MHQERHEGKLITKYDIKKTAVATLPSNFTQANYLASGESEAIDAQARLSTTHRRPHILAAGQCSDPLCNFSCVTKDTTLYEKRLRGRTTYIAIR